VDPIDVLILGLRLLFVALLYLFVVLVIRVSIRTLRAAPRQREHVSIDIASGLRLEVIEAGGSRLEPGQVLSVGDGAVLGRRESADVVLADAAVSSAHAQVHRGGRGWVVADLGSTNGTRINGAAIKGESPLSLGDVLGLGNVRLKVVAR
jgi:hypothetical protein